jgi:hypothetical protein
VTVTADSYEAQAIALAINMLAGSATFRTLVGAASAAEALDFIIETHSGAPGANDGRLGMGKAVSGKAIDLAKPNYAIVGMDPGLGVDTGGVGYYDYEFSIGVRLVQDRLLSNQPGGETPAEGTRRAWNVTGLVRFEMQGQVGSGTTTLADAEIRSEGLFLDEEGVHRQHIITQLLITARG